MTKWWGMIVAIGLLAGCATSSPPTAPSQEIPRSEPEPELEGGITGSGHDVDCGDDNRERKKC